MIRTYLGHQVAETQSWHANHGWEKFHCLKENNDPQGFQIDLQDRAKYLGDVDSIIERHRSQKHENQEENCVEKMKTTVSPSSSCCYRKYGACEEN